LVLEEQMRAKEFFKRSLVVSESLKTLESKVHKKLTVRVWRLPNVWRSLESEVKNLKLVKWIFEDTNVQKE